MREAILTLDWNMLTLTSPKVVSEYIANKVRYISLEFRKKDIPKYTFINYTDIN